MKFVSVQQEQKTYRAQGEQEQVLAGTKAFSNVVTRRNKGSMLRW